MKHLIFILLLLPVLLLGQGPSNTAINNNIPYSINGKIGPKGSIGSTGPQGIQGSAGNDGTNGTNGVDGTNGIDGKSAYQSWLDAGNTGTETDFLNSLVGATGPQGVQGPACQVAEADRILSHAPAAVVGGVPAD